MKRDHVCWGDEERFRETVGLNLSRNYLKLF